MGFRCDAGQRNKTFEFTLICGLSCMQMSQEHAVHHNNKNKHRIKVLPEKIYCEYEIFLELHFAKAQ